jgi:hypothetical protein
VWGDELVEVEIANCQNRVPVIGKSVKPRKTALVMQIGPGDDSEPVITIAMPGEN